MDKSDKLMTDSDAKKPMQGHEKVIPSLPSNGRPIRSGSAMDIGSLVNKGKATFGAPSQKR